MMKRIIALLLALILTVSLLPTVALAAGETANNDVKFGSIGEDGNWTPEAPDQSNMPKGVETVSKTAKKVEGKENEYEVKLEVVLKQTSETKTGAAATALVLDCSGSMERCTKCGKKSCKHTTEVTYNQTYTVNHDYNYYVKNNNGQYVSVEYCDGTHGWFDQHSCTGGAGWYTESGRKDHTSDKKFTPKTSVDDTDTAHTQFYTRTGGSNDTSRMTAAKNAAKNFLKTYSGFDASVINDNGTLKQSAENLSIKRYVAVIRFSNNIDNNTDSSYWGDYKPAWYDVSTKDGYGKVLATINNASAGGGTNLDAGLTTASSLMDANLVKNLTSKNVIALTDGAPTYSKRYGDGGSTNKDICDETAQTAATLRGKSKVYTVCFAAESDPLYNGGGTVGDFLKNRIATQPAEGSNEKYAYNATSAEDLIKVFKDITDTIVSGLNNGTVKDSLPTGITSTDFGNATQFELNDQKQFHKDVKTETVDGKEVTTYTYTKTYTVKIDPDDKKLVTTRDGYAPLNGETTLTVEVDGKKETIPFPIPAGKVTPTKITTPIVVKIKGGTDTKTYNGTEYTVSGYEVESITPNNLGYTANDFTFTGTASASGTNAGKYQMNLSASQFRNTNTKYTNVTFEVVDGWLEIKPIDLTITAKDNTVPYDGRAHGENGYEVTGTLATGETVTSVTITGSETEPGTYTDKLVPSNAVIKKGNTEVPSTNYNITYVNGTLTITADSTEKVLIIKGNKSEVTYDGGSHTVSGYDVTYPTGTSEADFTITLKNGKTGIVTETNVKTDGDGKYMMGLTAGDFNVESSKYSNVKVSYTEDGYLKINPRPITLKSGDASKTYDGAALTKKEVTVTSGNFVSGEGLDYDVTGSQTKVGTSKNTYTYTPKTGTTLTNYTITQEEGDLTVTLPDLTARPNVIVNCVNTEVPAHTEKNTSLTNADHYTVSTEATKVDGQSAYTRTITLTEAGKDYFISSEYVPEYGSHTPATNGNVTEITMTYSEVNGEWAWRASHANFLLNVECTTPTVEVDLGNYIKKTLTGTNFHENFSAEFKVDVAYSCDGNKTAVGSVTLTGAAANTPFNFDKITLKQGFYYIFAVTEREANVSGVTCDTTTHEFALNVKTDGTVEFGSVVDKQFVPAGAEADQFLTITNTYAKPTYAVKKSVVEDPSIIVPTGVDKMGYQYPTGGKFIVEKTYTDDTITFLYVIEVSGKNGAEMTIQEQDGGKFINVDYSAETRATVTLNAAQDIYTVKLTSDVDANDPIKLYAEKTFHKDADGKFPTTATNALLVNGEEGPKDDTTIIERGSTVIDFSKMVQKHLTTTGNGTVSEVTFYVDVVGGRRDDAIAYALPEVTISDTYRLVLMATFNSVTGNGYDETKPFEGAIPVNQAGVYIFKLTERTDAAQTSITYDETEYLLYVNVEPKSDGSLEVTDWHIVGSDNTEFNAPGKITFHNTIDTGKDDYYPIIIPTIINKDTGMLNKTDHFAYVIGYPDGTVHPNGQITRAEVATIFFRLLRDEVRDGAFTTSNSYSDVAYGKWYNNPISTMSALGIITGYPDGTFKPNKPITRAEFAAIAARFDETQSGKSATFSDVIGHWAAKEIGIAYYNDWIKGYPDGTFKPDQNITRAEAMTLINRVLERKPESPADLLTNMNKWTDNMDTSKWYYLDVQEATNSHGYTRKTFNYELWRQMLPDPDWSRYER